MHTYDNQFAIDNVYGHATNLLGKFSLQAGGIHLDFGCGFGRIAEALRDRLGLRYIGLDILEAGLDSLKERGFEVMFFNLHDPDAGVAILNEWLPKDVPIVSMSCLDTLEHLAEPEKAVGLLRRIAGLCSCPLVISVPNAAHRDIGLKLLAGQFEYTESGLLDHTHFQYFTERSLTDRMASQGWHEAYRNDVLLEVSDQNFPPNQPLLSSGTPINALLRYLRRQIDGADTVNQFVRTYLPAAPRKLPAAAEEITPFLTVVTRTQGQRIEMLRETLLCLSAQTCQDFEVLVIGHKLTLEQQLHVERVIADLHAVLRERTRLIKVDRGERAAPLNSAFESARGQYVSMLDDDDLVFGHWVESFKTLHQTNPGKLLRSTAILQTWDTITVGDHQLVTRSKSGYSPEYPERFDLFDHLVQNRSPFNSLAFPRSIYRDLGFRFDETLTTAEDWDFIIRISPITGVACTSQITCVYRRWENLSNSHTMHDLDEWHTNYQHTLRKIDATPLILPVGYTRKIREILLEVNRLRQGPVPCDLPYIELQHSRTEVEYLEALRSRLYALVNSRSWRYTTIVRYSMKIFTGKKTLPEMRIWCFSARELEDLIAHIENSRTWKYTSMLRKLLASMRKLVSRL